MSICVKMNLENIKHKLLTPQFMNLEKSLINEGHELWQAHFRGDKPAKISGTVIEKPLVLIDSK